MLTLELPKLKSSELMEKMARLDVSGILWKSLPKQISTLLIPKVKSYAPKSTVFGIRRYLSSYLGMVLFDDGEDLQVIEVPLISSSKFEEFVEFKVVLIEPQGKCSLGNNQKENI